MSVKNGKAGTMRERVTPANPKTASQANVRGAFKSSSQAFKNMPELDAAAWDEVGKTLKGRDGKPLTGIAAYNQLAIVYRLINPGATAPLTPPPADFVPPDLTIVASAEPNSVMFEGIASTPTGVVAEFLLQKLPAGNRKPTLDGYRTVGYAALQTASGNKYVADVSPGRYAAAYRFCDSATGQQSTLVQLSVLGVTLQVVKGGSEAAEKSAARKKAA